LLESAARAGTLPADKAVQLAGWLLEHAAKTNGVERTQGTARPLADAIRAYTGFKPAGGAQ
jgi:hypothetical protein